MKNKKNSAFVVICEAIRSVHLDENNELNIHDIQPLLHFFQGVEDFRQQGKIVFPLPNILLMTMLAIIKLKNNSFLDIASYIYIERKWFRDLGLLSDERCPSHDTIRRVFMYLDAEALRTATILRLHDFLKSLQAHVKTQNKYSHHSLDGKENCGTGVSENARNPKPNIAHLNVYDNTLKTCIQSIPIDCKTNEIPIAQALLQTMHLKKCIITADALHTQKQTCDIIAKRRGFYVFPVKQNHKLLVEEIKTRMLSKADKLTHISTDTRDFAFYELPKNYATDGFTGMNLFVMMTSRVRKKAITLPFITNLKDKEAVIEVIEQRWEIENNLHKQKDSFLNEDGFQCSNPNAALAMTLMNNLALVIIELFHAISGHKTLSHSKIYVNQHPIEAFNSLLAVMDADEIIEKIKMHIKKAK